MFKTGWRSGRACLSVRCEYHRSYDLLRKFDAVVDVSGLAYADAFGPDAMRRALWFWIAAASQKKPIFFMPQSWGPFADFSREDRRWLRFHLNRAELVFARDAQSAAHLLDLKIEKTKVKSCPDIAFLTYRHCTNDKVTEQTSGTIAVVPNMRFVERTPGTGPDNEYVTTLVSICELIASQGFRISLLAHEIAKDRTRCQDDTVLCNCIADELSGKGIPVNLPTAKGTKQIAALIAGCEGLVSSRYHAAIAGLAVGTPVFLIGWHHKYSELFCDFGIEDSAVDLDAVSEERREQTCQRAIHWLLHKNKDAQLIRSRQKEVIDAGNLAFDQVADILLRRH